MQTVDRTGVHIDVCQDCKGIFLDRGELERLIDAALIYHQAAEAREREAAAKPADTGANPVTTETPVPAQPPPYQPEPGYAPPPPVYQAPGYAPPPVPPGYGQPAPYGHDPYHGHDPHYRRRKKKDFLSELFGL